MFKKSLSLGALALSLIAGSANAASIFLDFNGSQDGASIGSFYNGGTDSFGNSGTNYGITFNSGATVRVDNGRTYLANVSSMFVMNGFTEGMTFLYSTFNTQSTNAGNADMSDFSVRLNTDPDPSYWTPLGNTYFNTCDAYPDTYCRFSGGFADVVGDGKAYMMNFGPSPWSGFTFATVAMDSITIGITPITTGPNSNIPANTFIGDTVNAEVPEPTTTALFGLGLLGVAAAARRRKK